MPKKYQSYGLTVLDSRQIGKRSIARIERRGSCHTCEALVMEIELPWDFNDSQYGDPAPNTYAAKILALIKIEIDSLNKLAKLADDITELNDHRYGKQKI